MGLPRGRPKGYAKTGGRVKGTPNHSTNALKELVAQYCPAAIAELGRLAIESENEAVRISAIKELLDRRYGRAVQPVINDSDSDAIQRTFTITIGRAPTVVHAQVIESEKIGDYIVDTTQTEVLD
jgi:hypothetical protein